MSFLEFRRKLNELFLRIRNEKESITFIILFSKNFKINKLAFEKFSNFFFDNTLNFVGE